MDTKYIFNAMIDYYRPGVEASTENLSSWDSGLRLVSYKYGDLDDWRDKVMSKDDFWAGISRWSAYAVFPVVL